MITSLASLIFSVSVVVQNMAGLLVRGRLPWVNGKLDRQPSQALHTAQGGDLSQMAEDVVAHRHSQHPASASRAAECLDIIVECRRVEVRP